MEESHRHRRGQNPWPKDLEQTKKNRAKLLKAVECAPMRQSLLYKAHAQRPASSAPQHPLDHTSINFLLLLWLSQSLRVQVESSRRRASRFAGMAFKDLHRSSQVCTGFSDFFPMGHGPYSVTKAHDPWAIRYRTVMSESHASWIVQ